MIEQAQLKAGIAALEAQRTLLGDAVVDIAVAPLRAKLAEMVAPAAARMTKQTLKQASVLFLDVVGSTAIGLQLDPEDIHAVMDGALEAFTSIIETHRGRVLQYAGDNLLAVFGAPEASEDDAERAVRAGLALLAAAQPLAQAVKARHGIDGFNVRGGSYRARAARRRGRRRAQHSRKRGQHRCAHGADRTGRCFAYAQALEEDRRLDLETSDKPVSRRNPCDGVSPSKVKPLIV
jgi:class 3 adenylate cyclase